MGCAPRFITKEVVCAKLMGLALYYQGDLFHWTALLSYPLAESTLH